MKFFDHHKSAILLVMILLLGTWLRVRLSQDCYVHKWDERFHALVAKNAMKEPLKPTLYNTPLLPYDYTKWYSNHVWVHKQPLPIWLITISYSTFGVGDFATRVPSLIFGILSIYITCLLGKYLFDRKTALLAAFFMAINGLVIEIGSGRIATDHYDLLFMSLIELAILFAYHNSVSKKTVHSFISGLFIGLAILTKWLPGLIVLMIHYFFLKRQGFTLSQSAKHICISLVTSLITFLPWQIYILTYFPNEAKWEYLHNWLHLSQELDGQTGGYFYFLDKIRINYSEIIYIPLIYMIYTLYKNKFKENQLMAFFVWIFVPILFFSIAKTKMQGYILFICPALFLITAHFFFELKDRWLKMIHNKSLKIFSILLLIAIIILPLRYCLERTAFGFKAPKKEDYVDLYKSITPTLPAKALVLNVKEPIEFMFYTGSIAYSTDNIDNRLKDSISHLGYEIFVLDSNKGTITPYNKD